MNKKIITLIMIGVFLIVGGSTINAEVENPETFTYVTTGNQDTLDPHYSYDTSSNEIIYQVYENLIAYDGESVDEFKPLLVKEVPSKDNGLINEEGTEYTFELKEDIEFSNGNDLTPEDVKYSFMRAMVFDRTGGPSWTVLKPLLDYKSLSGLTEDMFGKEDPKKLNSEESAAVYEKMDESISIDGNKITFKLAKPYPPFLNIVAHGMTITSIIDKEWSIEQGAWDGKAETIAEYHDPSKEEDPLFDVMMGTGPFTLEEWDNGQKVILKRNENYWREAANFETAIIRSIDEFSTRQLMIDEGDADMIYVPPAQVSQFEDREDIKVNTDIPALENTVGVMNWEINTDGNDYIGSGKLDGKGIPDDFFADKNIRKAFSYAFNYKAFIDEV
ncbi:MAG: ABC transporter substrate-binding protein, partial [Bacillota bacterium]